MKETSRQFAHRCLPLLIANQSGWLLLTDVPFQVVWDGGPSIQSLRIEYLEGAPETPLVSSLFGQGILTWSVGYIFRTPPGFNLLVRGPANLPKDGISPLEGVVETDWAVAPFTMNWKLTRPHHPLVFERGEPFCMIVPQRRYELEKFTPQLADIMDDPNLAWQWQEFERRRKMSNQVRLAVSYLGAGGAERVPWERHYFEGSSPGGASGREHQKKLSLGYFASGGTDEERRRRRIPDPSDPAPSPTLSESER